MIDPDVQAILDALTFYADPDTYFAIGFFPDPPCGEFMDDFDEFDSQTKPGAAARKALKAFFKNHPEYLKEENECLTASDGPPPNQP